jgi:hypothetical protein
MADTERARLSLRFPPAGCAALPWGNAFMFPAVRSHAAEHAAS